MWTRNKNIDLGLDVLAVVMTRIGYREPLHGKVIAEICGCNRHSIENVEKRAIKKLRWRAKELYEEFSGG